MGIKKEDWRKMHMKEYGYIRVSTKEQNEARQFEAMKRAGIKTKQLLMDKQSGADFERPQYQKLLKKLRRGDSLFVKSIDRIGRNYTEIKEQWRMLTQEMGVDIIVLDMPLLDTRKHKDLTGTLIADIVLQLLSYVAEVERNNIKERQAEGIAVAKKQGKHLGRKPLTIPEGFEPVCQRWLKGEISQNKAAALLGVSGGTFKRWVTQSGQYPIPLRMKNGRKIKSEHFAAVYEKWKRKEIKTKDAAKVLRVSPPTFLKWAHEEDAKKIESNKKECKKNSL